MIMIALTNFHVKTLYVNYMNKLDTNLVNILCIIQYSVIM